MSRFCQRSVPRPNMLHSTFDFSSCWSRVTGFALNSPWLTGLGLLYRIKVALSALTFIQPPRPSSYSPKYCRIPAQGRRSISNHNGIERQSRLGDIAIRWRHRNADTQHGMFRTPGSRHSRSSVHRPLRKKGSQDMQPYTALRRSGSKSLCLP